MASNRATFPSARNEFPVATEEVVQIQIVSWFKHQFPQYSDLLHGDAMANAITGGSTHMGKNGAAIAKLRKAKNMGASGAWPDLNLCVSRGKYHGLFIELKRDRKTLPFRAKESAGIQVLKKDDHTDEQAAILSALNHQHYYACFSGGFEMTRSIIVAYMEERLAGCMVEMETSSGRVIWLPRPDIAF